MHAIVLDKTGSPENFALREVPDPVNKSGHVLIRVKAAAFNPIDYQMMRGSSEIKLLQSPVLGRECSGIVLEGGGTAFRPGDEVFSYIGSLGSNGTYAEMVSAPCQLVSLKPANLSFEEAAAIPMVGLTALQCAERLNIDRSSSVFIAGGGGGVGMMLVRLLRLSGISRIITTAGNEQTRQQLIDAGINPNWILNYHDDDLANVAITMNSGNRFDYCIDIVGGSMSELCAQVLKTNGKHADIAFLGTRNSYEKLFDIGAVIYNISNYAYALEGDNNMISYYGSKLNMLSDLLGQRKLLPPRVHCIGELNASTVKEAHLAMESNATRGAKLVMRVS